MSRKPKASTSDPFHPGGVRLDKWLWAARFFKTRSLAQQAIDGGKVHVEGERSKPGRLIRTGQKLDVRQGHDILEITILKLSEKRGPAPVARTLYEESEASIAERKKAAELRKEAAMAEPRFDGRPDKRQRRQIEKLLRQNFNR